MKISQQAITKIARKYNLKLIVLFGSQVQKQIHNESDVDIAFVPSRKIDEEGLYLDLVHAIKRADIDLVNLFTLHNHILRYEILSKGAVLYEIKVGLKSKMEGESFIDYVDFKQYYNLRSKLIDKKILELTA
ncbi:MAG: nucleotidyltransferase domain-containing protein [archaeon]|nr:nucleotidyltransferase domain-containing protein [archaeon]